MKKNRVGFDCFLIFFGALCLMYFGILLMNISFSNFLIIYPLITLVSIVYATIELVTQQSILAFLHPALRYTLIMLTSVIVISFIVAQCILLYNGNQKYDKKSDYTIILGAQVNGSEISESLKNRLDAGLEIYKMYPDMIFIVSGGQGINEDRSEASFMNEYLLEKGIPDKQVILENRSRNTYQNLLYSKQLLDQFSNGEYDITIVTNTFHTYRSKLIAEDLGLNANTYAADAQAISEPNFYIREYFALLKDMTLMMFNEN